MTYSFKYLPPKGLGCFWRDIIQTCYLFSTLPPKLKLKTLNFKSFEGVFTKIVEFVVRQKCSFQTCLIRLVEFWLLLEWDFCPRSCCWQCTLIT